MLGAVTRGRVAIALTAIIVVGGSVLALTATGLSGNFGTGGQALAPPNYVVTKGVGSNYSDYYSGVIPQSEGNGVTGGLTQVVGPMETITMSTTTTYATTTSAPYGSNPPVSNVTQGSPGGFIEFSSGVSLRSPSPEQTASGVVELAYSVGGYVAYQSTYSNSAYVVIRVPATQYQAVLGKVESMGTVISLTSNSNDVQVQYTDLNATLASLRTEKVALLRLMNESTTINSTLAIETQLQGVNAQINEVESEILQTRTLIEYSTIDVTVTETAAQVPLSVTLSATPDNGTSPLSVTFNAVVKGGAPPYIVNYNFGDGYASEGQIVILCYYQAVTYKVLVSATDQNGTVKTAAAVVKVAAPAATSGIGGFFGYVGTLFLGVIEGIVEVAVVVLPIAAVGALVVVPIQRRSRSQRAVKPGQQA